MFHPRTLVSAALCFLLFVSVGLAVPVIEVDLIDEVFKSGGSSPWTQGASSKLATPATVGLSLLSTADYDMFDVDTSLPDIQLGSDGLLDIQINIYANYSGVAAGVDFEFSHFRNGTGLRSEIASSGTPDFNNPGTLNSQTIEILFLHGANWTVEADNSLLASLSSANTINTFFETPAGSDLKNTNAWEMSTLQWLNADGTPFSTASVPSYVEDQTSQSVTGAGTYVASGDTQDGVGTTNAGDDADGLEADDRPVLSFTNAGIAAGTRIGGLRFSHYLTDTRGTNDTGGFDYSATINELNITATPTASAVPEPSSFFLLGAVGLMGGLRRWVRKKTRDLSI